jgi:hypothetical protein
LGNISGVALEGNADDLVVLKDWAAGVSRVDRGINLNSKVVVYAGVTVSAEVDT